ncbi:uncharacterized protein F4822DRAFT_396813 [Hypoxylon trugodes]|uniref:uncharacterized protein n=1 Tax=Hypoxylon trugodes TaxID=326681 RepID=UPI00219B4A2F|nr:uncharacterized protein F4822DRAFT_396813 [Hypoxylon trugodes]KAI1391463.1 hypothetical protein F4822DRAFT_396813 [Hypoxylon trugodes]
MRSLVLGALPRARGCNVAATTTSTFKLWATTRTFTTLPRLRPTILSSSSSCSTVFRSPNLSSGSILTPFTPVPSAGGEATGVSLDLVPKTAITAHPAFAQQMRFGPRPTMARSSRLIRKRRHGFLSRIRSRNGQKTLQRRRDKKRSALSS